MIVETLAYIHLHASTLRDYDRDEESDNGLGTQVKRTPSEAQGVESSSTSDSIHSVSKVEDGN
jgi:hypothetical protein